MPRRERKPASAASIGEWLPIGEVEPWAKNPRRNDGKPVDGVAASIARFGFVAPIVVWSARRRVVAGHTRLKALQLLLSEDPTFAPPGAPGPGLVPVRKVDFASEADADAYALADNRLHELSDWDDAKLRDIARELDADLMRLAGFDDKALKKLIADADATGTGTDPQLGPMIYRIIVDVEDETQQATLIEELEARGLKCVPLIS